MASVLLSPYGNGQQFFDDNGVPLAGGLIYTYQAGSSTPLATYTTNGGNIANSNPIVLDASGRVPNEIWLFTGFSYKFVLKNADDVLIQTLDNIYPILQNAPESAPAIPSGGIIIWSGSTGSVPSGWFLCDGTNGTPDLRNSFIVGAGSTYAVGATGGSADSIVVSHNHALTDPQHKHVTAIIDSAGSLSFGNTDPTTYTGIQGGVSTNYAEYTNSVSTGITLASAGVSGTNANLPPYYALAYIMKG